MRRFLPLLLLASVVLSALAVPAQAGRTATVTLEDVAFKPGKLTIRKGDRVRFVWKDGPYTGHNVRSRGTPRFKGSGTRTSGSYTVRFARKGTYRYVCTIHLGMDGRIVVK